ncbi:Exo-poly-alpha-D-galacturonosidase [Nymphaea thermarum]|nr:Exo-poly-alpha-D-galacturonosidase [Nymphaea thermarum]
MHRRPFFRIFLLIVWLSAADPQQEPPPSQAPTVPDRWKLHGRPFNVVDYGAAGDGRRYDTKAIQAAVDACTAAGGGRVVLPSPGRYLTGTIFLRSGVLLVVEKGARLLGSPSQLKYPRDQRRWYVVLAERSTDVGITGGGGIDGQGEKFVERYDERKNVMVSWNATGSCRGDECRPRLVGFVDCQNIRVWDVRLTQPAYWWMFPLSFFPTYMFHQMFCSLHIVRSNNTLIHDVAIDGDFNTPNNDGIDIEDSNNTIIFRCSIDTGDDAICPKSSLGPVYNLSATHCWIRTKSSAIKLGSASWFNFKNFLFDNITIVESHRGLAFQIRDGGNASDIVFSNIKIETRYYHHSWWGRAEPIYITSCPRQQDSKAGSISNIKFINVSAVSENGAFLSGSAKGLLSGIEFINVNLTFRRWTNFDGGIVDYRPGCQGLVKHRTAGIIMEHISGLVTENLKMDWAQDSTPGWNTPLDFTPSTVNNIHLTDFQSTVL